MRIKKLFFILSVLLSFSSLSVVYATDVVNNHNTRQEQIKLDEVQNTLIEKIKKAETKLRSFSLEKTKELHSDLEVIPSIELSYTKVLVKEEVEKFNRVLQDLELMIQKIEEKDREQLLFVVPHFGNISSEYGYRVNPFNDKEVEFHTGIDITGKGDILASLGGKVSYVGNDPAGYGIWVEIDHGTVNNISYKTRYAHLSKTLVKVGDYVNKGDVIALMGNTGRSTGQHLHFEVLENDLKVNPRKYIDFSKNK